MPTRAVDVKKRRVLFLDLGSNFGGVEVYLQGLAEALGTDADLYAVCSLSRLNKAFRSNGVRVVSLSVIGSKWFKPLRLLIAILLVPWVVIFYRIYTIQINGYFESLLLLPLSLLGRRTVYTMHGPFETELYKWHRNPARFLPRFFSQYSLQFASTIVCVSETVGQIARTILPQEKVIVIPNWVRLPVLPIREHDADQTVRLLYVGRVERYKGIHLIIEALKGLSGMELLVVGDGTYRKELERLAHGLPVRFVGFHNNPAVFYGSADIFINPSLGPEGLPIVSLESMSYALPCIMSDLPVHREITDNGSAAALFVQGNADHLQHQIRRLAGNRDLMRWYGLAARKAVESKYSSDVASRRYQELLLNAEREGIHAGKTE